MRCSRRSRLRRSSKASVAGFLVVASATVPLANGLRLTLLPHSSSDALPLNPLSAMAEAMSRPRRCYEGFGVRVSQNMDGLGGVIQLSPQASSAFRPLPSAEFRRPPTDAAECPKPPPSPFTPTKWLWIGS